MSEVIDFKTRDGLVHDGLVLDVDDMLEAIKGDYVKLVVVGETADGQINVHGNDSAPESLMLLQWAAAYLVANRVARDA